MNPPLATVLSGVFAVAALAYLVMAVYVSRSAPRSVIGFFLFFIAAMVGGSAFSVGATDAGLYGIGRVLSFFGGGFVPVAFYVVYRNYTSTPPSALTISVLSIIPIATTVLALTNSQHGLIWTATETVDGLSVSAVTSHFWFRQVHAPYTYGLFGFAAIALASRLPTIAPAHRRTVIILIASASLPFLASVANTFAGIGPIEFPVLSLSLTLMLPVYAYASLALRMFEFSPLAYEQLFHHVRDPIFVLDNRQRIVCANKRAQELLGFDEHELLGQYLWEDFPEARRILEQAKELDLTQTLKMQRDQIFEVSVAPLANRRGEQQGVVVVCRDVTERRIALAQLADSEHLIRTLVETSSNGILRFSPGEDGTFRCVFANRAADSFLPGYGSLVGKPVSEIDELQPDRLIDHFGDDESGLQKLTLESSRPADGETTWLRVVAEPVGRDFSVTLIDITKMKLTEDKMLADALRDPLTGVLNRRGFEKEAKARLRQSANGAVLYLDLNQFKAINDRFGHQAGDALLKAFGHRLEYCLRPEDVLGRLGGDEFAIVLPGVSVDDAKHVARRLVQSASEPYIIKGQSIHCDASVGVALMPKHGEELWHLISVADQAMYDAKSRGISEAANDQAAYVESIIAS